MCPFRSFPVHKFREVTARASSVAAQRLWHFEMNGDFPIPTLAILWRVDE